MHPDSHDERRRRLTEAQAAAELPPRPGIAESADVRAYRRLYAALRQVPLSEPPADFGRLMEARVRDADEQAMLEVWLLRLCAVVAAITGTWLAGPSLIDALGSLRSSTGAPWSWMLPAALTLGGAWLVDRWLPNASSTQRGN